MLSFTCLVREAREDDLKEVLDIEYKCFPDPYPLELLYRLRSLYSDMFLVAEVEDKVVGYVIGAIKWFRTGHILAIAVDPPYQGRGIGSKLMEEIMQRFQLKGARIARLEVRKSNVMAQNFYRKLGFAERFEVPFYYEDGETAIAMERDL